jgi:hypothetical protein
MFFEGKHMTKFGDAPIVREGGIADPDRYTWQCDLDKCKKCRDHYADWKAAFDAEQKQLRGENT